MSVIVEIPDSVAQALGQSEPEQAARLRLELAVTLYAQNLLSFGKARELAGVDHLAFGRILAERNVPRHYTAEELKDDLAYARGE